jgi:hypothetical protein
MTTYIQFSITSSYAWPRLSSAKIEPTVPSSGYSRRMALDARNIKTSKLELRVPAFSPIFGPTLCYLCIYNNNKTLSLLKFKKGGSAGSEASRELKTHSE